MHLPLVLTIVLGGCSETAVPPTIPWHPDLATAETAAGASGRALLVVFR